MGINPVKENREKENLKTSASHLCLYPAERGEARAAMGGNVC